MNIVVYANASYNIGTGHVMRCLALADFLKSKGCKIIFMTDMSLPGNLSSLIVSKGYEIIKPCITTIPDSTDWLIIDNYHIDIDFEIRARKKTKYIMVIDDLANRQHDCDILLDQNLYNNMNERYQELVPKNCKLLLGPKYALLRDEFLQERKTLKKRDGKINRILVNFGGIDHVDMTSRVLDILKNYKIEIDIVIGKNSLYLDKLNQIFSKNQYFNLHVQTPNMAKLLAKCDLAISAGGTSIWERCCLGLPSIVVAIADNQLESSETLAENGLCFYAGFYNEENIEDKISKILDSCFTNPDMLKNQSEKIMLLSNGSGKKYVWDAIASWKI